MTSPHRHDDAYQLIALPRTGAVAQWRHIGSYPDLDTTLRARIDDVLAQLVGNDGWLITCEHLVIGPGPTGRRQVANHVTQLGSDPGSDRIPDPYDEPATRRWLLAAHQLPA